MIKYLLIWIATGICWVGALQAKPVEIVVWHSLAGQLGVEAKALFDGFNRSQTQYVLKSVYKGDYLESLTSFAAAFRAKQPPALVQIFEVGTPNMLSPKGIIKPVDDLMLEQGFKLPKDSFFPAIRAYYSQQGNLMAMPFNISVPVLYYNADALAKIGYSAEAFPRTWNALEELADRLQKTGFECVYTTAYPAWIMIESYAAIHGIPLIDVTNAKALYNSPVIVKHLERLLRWQKQHYFEYGGRSDDATALFISGRCPIFSQSSGSYGGLVGLAPFRVGMAALPKDEHSNMRFNNITGGAALWVVAGQPPEVYRGIAHFFAYLVQPKVQQNWHQQTGYLPLGARGIYQWLTDDNRHPSFILAQAELAFEQNEKTGECARIPNQIRLINDEALEAVFAGIANPQEALNKAVKRANYALRRFANNTQLT